jgi:glycosyltransferase involved in cell wall biosynthesis
MAVFNTPFDSIKRALDSVMNQDLRDFELLVVDDSSIDLGIQLISY